MHKKSTSFIFSFVPREPNGTHVTHQFLLRFRYLTPAGCCFHRDIVREINFRERQRLVEEHQSHVALLEAEIARLEVHRPLFSLHSRLQIKPTQHRKSSQLHPLNGQCPLYTQIPVLLGSKHSFFLLR